MFRWLLNHTSTWSLLLFVVGGTTAVVVAATYLVRRSLPHLAQTRHEPASTAIRGVFALLYGLIFALSISNLSSASSAANSTTATEATSLALLVRSTHAFSAPAQIALRNALGNYDVSVIKDEFPAMRMGQASPRTAAELDNLYGVYQYLQDKGGPDAVLAANSIAQLNAVTTNRRSRLSIAQQGLPGLLRLLLVVGVVLLIVLSLPTKMWSLPMQMLVMASIAAFLSFAFSITVLLDYPFSGTNSVSPAVFKQGALNNWWIPPPDPVPPADQVQPLTNSDLVGLWNNSNGRWGNILFRDVGGQIEATFRHDNGTIVGNISADGVFRGWWCELPGRVAPNKAGEVEFRWLKGGGTKQLYGLRLYGATENPVTSNWDLSWVGAPDIAGQTGDAVEPLDLTAAVQRRHLVLHPATRRAPKPPLIASAPAEKALQRRIRMAGRHRTACSVRRKSQLQIRSGNQEVSLWPKRSTGPTSRNLRTIKPPNTTSGSPTLRRRHAP